MNTPLVSIIVPSFNHVRFIYSCIESIYAQTYKNFELTVIDDGSSDGSIEVLKTLQIKFGFRLVLQENKGICYVLNKGIKEYSSGDYITFCASDDFWLPKKLELQVSFLEANKFYPMCFGRAIYVDENSNIIDKFSVVENLYGGYIFEDILLFKIHPPVNYMFRTQIFNEIGYYDESLVAEDYDMNLRISYKYAIGFIDQPLFCYRVYDSVNKTIRFDSVSNSHLKSINKFYLHRFSQKARLLVFLRKFTEFSTLTKLKSKAVENCIRSLPLFYKKAFIKACVKLLIYWR